MATEWDGVGVGSGVMGRDGYKDGLQGVLYKDSFIDKELVGRHVYWDLLILCLDIL